MRICHITSAHNTLDDRIYIRECKSLSKREENDVYIVGPGDSFNIGKVKVIGCGVKPKSRIRRFTHFSYNVIQNALKVNADVYHFHDPELLPFVLIFKLKKKKVIYDSHEFYRAQIMTKSYLPYFLRKAIATIFGIFEDYVVKKVDAVIFPCKINGRHPFEGKTKMYTFIDNRPTFDEFPVDFKRDYDNSNKYVCCAGGLSESRGVETLIEGCYKANVPLVLAGSFSNEEFKNRIFEKEEFKIVDYRGECSREEVRDIYRKAWLGVSNILWEGQYPYIENLPTKVYEYMMMELPFIISDFPYSKMIVEKYECGLSTIPHDADMLANAITYLVNNENEAMAMGKNGRQLVLEKLNWSQEEKKLFALYDSLL